MNEGTTTTKNVAHALSSSRAVNNSKWMSLLYCRSRKNTATTTTNAIYKWYNEMKTDTLQLKHAKT